MAAADKAEKTSRGLLTVLRGVSVLLFGLIGGGALAAIYGVGFGLDPGLQRAGNVLAPIATTPIGLWTLKFLADTISASALQFMDEVLNRFSVLGAIACAVGYFLLKRLEQLTQAKGISIWSDQTDVGRS